MKKKSCPLPFWGVRGRRESERGEGEREKDMKGKERDRKKGKQAVGVCVGQNPRRLVYKHTHTQNGRIELVRRIQREIHQDL